MTAKKYEIYIDTKKQDLFFEEKVFAKFVDIHSIHYADLLPLLKASSKYFQVSREITVNSGHKLVKELFERNRISKDKFYTVYRNYKKVKIYYWNLIAEDELPSDAVLLTNETYRLFAQARDNMLADINNRDLFYIIEFLNPNLKNTVKKKLDNRFMSCENTLFIQSLLEKNKPTKLMKYQLYLDQRLLIERFFPESLMDFQSLVESVYLELKRPSNLKLITSEDLYIVKLVMGDSVFYPNSKEFILEP